MPTLLHIVSYGAALVVFVSVTLSLASGLLWLAEVIEEHSRTAKSVGKRVVYAIILFHILLYFVDSNLPLKPTVFSIACHFVYLLNFRNFPIISLTSWSFMASCLLVVADHFMWFFHFHEIAEAARKRERRWRHPMEPVPHVPTFFDIVTFFGICVWLVPLFLFLSLTANENALPTSRHGSSTRASGKFESLPTKPPRSSLFVSLSSKVLSLLPSRASRGRSSGNSDGIIAPRASSRPPSPLHPIVPALLSPGFQPRSPSPSVSPSSLMPPRSPLHSPVGSPSSTSFGSGSWIPVDSGSRPPSRPSTPGNPGDETVSTRRRINLQAPTPRRTESQKEY
ncbi:DUF396-domain-containing protein [Ramaria rubella]|nr:DUF396-domain-containing protein [Ramaria rubella]